jgi:hypothetical protein
VEVVVDDAVRVQEPAEAPLRLVDPAHDGVAVEVVANDGLPRNAADGHVNDAMWREERRAGAAGHCDDGSPPAPPVPPQGTKRH